MVQDDDKAYLRYLDTTQPIMEFSIYKLFSINLIQLIKNKAALAKNFNIQPSEIDRMQYWEYEFFLDEVNNIIKAENEQQEKQAGDYNVNSMMRGINKNMPKMPNTNFYKTPSMPKFSTPKF